MTTASRRRRQMLSLGALMAAVELAPAGAALGTSGSLITGRGHRRADQRVALG